MVSRIRGFVGLATAIAIVAALLLAVPAVASAADTYANSDSGSNSNDCLSISTPCLTVTYALSQSGAGDTTFLDGVFGEDVTLGQGKSLEPVPDPVGQTQISGNVGITIDPSGAGHVNGMFVTGYEAAMQVNGAVTIDDGVFGIELADPITGSDIKVQTDDPVVISNSRFYTADAGPSGSGITVDSPAASVEITHNVIGVFSPGLQEFSSGIRVLDGGADLLRNEILGTDVAVRVTDSPLPVTLSNDLIHDNTVGLQATDTSLDTPPSTQGDVSATNETIFNSSDTDVRLDHTTLIMNSSIVGTPVDLVGAGACDISFSRGPVSSVGSGCDGFDTNADPQFVNAVSGNYALQSSSPLIDIGDPTSPGLGAADFYGGPRELQGKACSTVRRDIGAAEFDPGSPPGCDQDTYADTSNGNDDNDCVSAGSACQTIGAALAKMGPNHTTFVAGGTYNESVTLDQGKSLVSPDSTNPKPIIDSGGVGNPAAIRVDGNAGIVSGFRVRSDKLPMLLQDATVEVKNNVFDEDTVPDENTDLVISGGTGIAVHHNVFVDPDASGDQAGINVQENPTDAVISDNTFTDLSIGVVVGENGAQIRGNQFSGARPLGPGFGGMPGAGVVVFAGDPTIARNTFGAPAQGPSAGVYVGKMPGIGPPPSGATLERNEISDQDVGVQVIDTDQSVTLSNDLIHGNGVGLLSTDSSADSPPSTQGDVSATNETIIDNTSDVSLDHTTLTMDSSIVGTPIDLVGAGACDISFSDGPMGTSSNGCGNFDTGADPQLVDPTNGDYHLLPTSPLIDFGNPADPGSGAVDFYGNPREVQGLVCSTVRRDIGASEFQPSSPPQCDQDTYADASGGDDANNCTTPATACQTIAAALAKMTAGHTTFVAGGTYNESVTLDQGKSLVSPDSTNPKPLIDGGVPQGRRDQGRCRRRRSGPRPSPALRGRPDADQRQRRGGDLRQPLRRGPHGDL